MRSPIYIEIHNQIRLDIEAGKWRVGQRIPAERDLAKKFGVSRMTLRQAIQTLVDEGILERHVGSGTYVASAKIQEKMSGITSFTDIMQAQGKVPSSKTVSYHLASPTLSEVERLELPQGNQVLRMERIRYADGLPISFETAAVPADLVEGFSKEEITASLYHALETKGNYQLGGAHQTVTATLASERIADFLKIKRNDAILKLRQVSFLKSGRPFEYVRTQYVGSRFEFYLER
ncbi:Transcriptional regulator [Agrilactobacillus composti DSM 18527 = JCM 14202]|jgi:GntR family transcriptional regulator|uniref:Transcriptional regulator n=1 Tax=Agrilactobacillus composti DSM 18527 = JCM 14202 TaxID=1423734 RepID=X0QR19_9LACO|nr:GntR family transcriptional regulator [Agrilactobacillus composti]KRM34977.1 Transcriptional regulator [Agrilactobacillus composti DSM 18527 = JCM 14202]MCH4172671.1 GntR family transcriptional regulator [Lactobacillus sp.]GAF41050.1 transcriptional regulator, GntR family [Agrilactobacillus composti DSM 18527 = JCM 14202]